MGVCQSKAEVMITGDKDYEEEEEFLQELNVKKVRVNKKTNETEEFDPADHEKPEDTFFEVDEEPTEEEGKQFLAVRPWMGAVMEPANHPEVNKAAPDEGYTLQYVYGYKCENSRQNVYYNAAGHVVYPTACLGVILNQQENTQLFFGGGEAENKSKQVACDQTRHSNDIISISVNTHGSREWAVTG